MRQYSATMHHLRLAGVMLPAVSLFSLAHAQEQIPRIEEVVVTAQKREQQVIDVPMSVTAIGGGTLENLGINNALELSYRVPSLVVQESMPGKQLYTLRGVGNTFGVSPLVGVYLDEVDVTSTGPAQLDMKLYDLARVEVLRGPQGTLWGAGSVGGTLRFITHAPDLTRFTTKAEVSSFGTKRGAGSQEAKGAINVPLVSDVLGLRFAGTYQNWGGWIDHPAAGRKDINDNELINFRTRALWRPTERLEVNATAIVHRNEGGGKNIVNMMPLHESLFRSFIDPMAATPFEDDYEHFNLSMNYDFGPVTLVSATGYTQSDNYNVDTRSLALVNNIFPGVPGSNILNTFGGNRSQADVFTQELRLTSSLDSPFKWTAGAFYRDEQVESSARNFQSIGSVVTASNVPSASIGKNDSRAVFGDASYALSDRWTFGAGARYFEEDRYLADRLGPARSSGSFHDFSPRVYMSFAATSDINLYVNVAQGFRSGGFNPSAVVAAGGPATYDPEQVLSYELGSKMLLAGGRLYAELAVFYSDYTDMQAVGFLPGVPANSTSNIGEAEIRGVEWSFLWSVTDALRLAFSGSLIDSEVVELRATATSHRVGDPLDQVADHGFSISADYDFHWGASAPGFVRLGYNEQGPFKFTSRATGLVNPIGVSDTLSFLYANVGATFGNTTLEVFGRNLLDESGSSSASGQCCNIAAQPRPAQVGVRVAYDFE